jgi:hypothetical protein
MEEYGGYTEREGERDMRERGIVRESSKERGTRGHKNKETDRGGQRAQ